MEESSESNPYIRLLISDVVGGTGSGSSRRAAEGSRRADQYQIINYLVNRARATPIAESSSANESQELTASERRIRRRRFDILDEAGESEEELLHTPSEEDYIDFRTYPFTINWKDIYSYDNDSCKKKIIKYNL